MKGFDMAVDGIGNSKADIRPTQLKAGMEKTNLKNDKDKAIFDAMDTDKNGVLDQSEIEKFKQTYDKNGDDIATKKEAKKFIKDNGLKGSKIKKKDVIKFLQQSGVNTENVQDTEIQENGAVKINYKDGTSKTVNKDKSILLPSKMLTKKPLRIIMMQITTIFQIPSNLKIKIRLLRLSIKTANV